MKLVGKRERDGPGIGLYETSWSQNSLCDDLCNNVANKARRRDIAYAIDDPINGIKRHILEAIREAARTSKAR